MESLETTNTEIPRHPMTTDSIDGCCIASIQRHGANNPILSCGSCKTTLKLFGDEKSYKRYVTFSLTSGRKILTDYHAGFYIVAFRAFHSFLFSTH